jgi:hypothetical protein
MFVLNRYEESPRLRRGGCKQKLSWREKSTFQYSEGEGAVNCGDYVFSPFLRKELLLEGGMNSAGAPKTISLRAHSRCHFYTTAPDLSIVETTYFYKKSATRHFQKTRYWSEDRPHRSIFCQLSSEGGVVPSTEADFQCSRQQTFRCRYFHRHRRRRWVLAHHN